MVDFKHQLKDDLMNCNTYFLIYREYKELKIKSKTEKSTTNSITSYNYLNPKKNQT